MDSLHRQACEAVTFQHWHKLKNSGIPIHDLTKQTDWVVLALHKLVCQTDLNGAPLPPSAQRRPDAFFMGALIDIASDILFNMDTADEMPKRYDDVYMHEVWLTLSIDKRTGDFTNHPTVSGWIEELAMPILQDYKHKDRKQQSYTLQDVIAAIMCIECHNPGLIDQARNLIAQKTYPTQNHEDLLHLKAA